MTKFIYCILGVILVASHVIQGEPIQNGEKDPLNDREVIPLDELQQKRGQRQPQAEEWNQPNWMNGGEDNRFQAAPYPYQGYNPYAQAPGGNPYMQPRFLGGGYPQQFQQQPSYQPYQQLQAYPQPQAYQQPQTYQQPQAYQQPQYQPYQPYQQSQSWQTLPEYVAPRENYYQPEPASTSNNVNAETTYAEEVPAPVNGQASSWSAPQQTSWAAPQSAGWAVPQQQPAWSAPQQVPWAQSQQQSWQVPQQTSWGVNPGTGVVPSVPSWRKSYTPLPGQNGCYNRCRPSCSNNNGGCQPSCQSACNIRPTCGRRSQVQMTGSTMVCGRPGYNLQQQVQQQVQQQLPGGFYGPQYPVGGGGWYDGGSSWAAAGVPSNGGQYYPESQGVVVMSSNLSSGNGTVTNSGRSAKNGGKADQTSKVIVE